MNIGNELWPILFPKLFAVNKAQHAEGKTLKNSTWSSSKQIGQFLNKKVFLVV
jgi:hypothetical protein